MDSNHNKNLKYIIRIVLTLCLSAAMCMTMSIPKLSSAQTSGRLTEAFWNISASIKEKAVLATLLFVMLLFVNFRIDMQKTEKRKLFPVASGIIALVWLMGESFRIDDSLWTLHASFGQMIKSAIYFIGITYGLNQLIYYLYYALEKKNLEFTKPTRIKQRSLKYRIAKIYRDHTLLVSFATIFALWLPHLILAYPANFGADGYNQLAQFFGVIEYSDHHPIASTLLMGSFVEIGSIISYNFGLFFYITVQSILGALVLSYSLHLMRELKVPVWLRIISFACYTCVPYYTAYIGMFVKDVQYAYAVVLFMTELIYMLVQKENYFRSKRHLLLMAVSIIGAMLFRNNGKYIIYPTVAAILIYIFCCIKKSTLDTKKRRRILAAAAAVFITPVLLSEVFLTASASYLDVIPGSSREALSLFIQQTGRYVKKHGDEVTEDEKAVLSSVLDYENLAENYDPRISDPVKNTFKYDPTGDEFKDYLRVWAKQFTKHPFTYFEATMNQNYYLLYPFVANPKVYIYQISFDVSYSKHQERLVEKLGLKDFEPIARLKTPLSAFYHSLFYVPVLNVLSHPAFYVILLILLSMFSFYRKRFVWLLASLPLWLSTAIIVLAPVIQLSPRYAFPIIYSMPLMLAFFQYLGRKSSEKGSDAKTNSAF